MVLCQRRLRLYKVCYRFPFYLDHCHLAIRCKGSVKHVLRIAKVKVYA